MRIAIIGGGASAVCLTDALATFVPWIGSLHVFENSPQIWRGRAYQQDMDTVLVNSPAVDMSVRSGDPTHFQRWLRARYMAVGRSVPDFAPRTVYGDYLVEVAQTGIERLRARGWEVQTVQRRITGARRGERTLSLISDNLVYGPFDCVIIAVGVGQPADRFGLKGLPGYVADPYPMVARLVGIDPGAPVAVLGSGLTAVDTVLALDAFGHHGQVALLSRAGVLPSVRQRPIDYEPRHFVPAALHAMAGTNGRLEFSEVLALLRRELDHAGAEMDDVLDELARLERELPSARLQRHLAAVDSPRLGLRVLQTAVHVSGPDLWPLLPDEVRREVLGTRYRALMSLCCPMPPSSARTLLASMRSGRLVVERGEPVLEAAQGGGFTAVLPHGTRRVARVINCTSAPRHKVPLAAAGLVDSLVDQQLAIRHADGGLCVGTDNSLCNSGAANRQPDDPRLYAIGDITGGTFFFTFGIPSLVDRCRDIVLDLLMVGESKESYV
ncbi:FAD/NAD(P)-binding protein [Nocardia fluminea]|uniref:FAD/NAD(P)-binding protein n=1 Tax=Nocardia fluminea TaxID=134984 RepID=UPI0033E62210